VDDFGVLQDSHAVLRVAVTAAVASTAARPPGPAVDLETRGEADQALVGALVHRLFERGGGEAGDMQDQDAATARLRAFVRDDEIVGVDDVDGVLRQAVRAYLALCSQPGVLSDLASGERWFEVPFSLRPADQQAVLRGRFDCLVRQASGRVVMLEFKTGRPTAQHERQLEAYLTAARALFPDTVVEGRLVYARDAPVRNRPLDA
jgi:RecB family exonuclease